MENTNYPTRKDILTGLRQYYESIPEPKNLEALASTISQILDAEKGVTTITDKIHKQLVKVIQSSGDDIIATENYLADNMGRNALSLEYIQDCLEQKGIRASEDEIRQTVLSLNIDPNTLNILRVPNNHIPYTPRYTRLKQKHDEPLPPEVIEILRYFSC